MKLLRPSAFVAKLKAHWLWASGSFILAVFTAGYFILGTAGGSALAAGMLANPLSVFAERSPGFRNPGALAQTKLAYAKAKSPRREGAARVPNERVLSNLRSRPPVPPIASESDSQIPQSIGLPALGFPVLPEQLQGFPVLFAGPGVIGGTGVVGLPTGGGAGGTPGDSGTPVSAVPEPSDWAMVIAGFFLIGASLRSHRRRDAKIIAPGIGAIMIGTRR